MRIRLLVAALILIALAATAAVLTTGENPGGEGPSNGRLADASATATDDGEQRSTDRRRGGRREATSAEHADTTGDPTPLDDEENPGPSGELTGTLTSAGSPVSGARVRVVTEVEILEATSDADGRYRLEAVPVGTARVRVVPLRHVPPKERRVTIVEDAAAQLDFELRAGGGVTGRLLAAGTGRAIEGARVTVLTAGGRKLRLADDGSFELGGLAPGRHRLRIDAPGYVRRVVRIAVGEDGRVEQRDIELQRAATVAGVVVDGADRPLAGIEVNVDGRMDGFTVSGADGSFRLERVPVLQAVALRLRSDDHPETVTEPLTLEAGEERTGLRLVVGSGGAIHGRVVRADGTPADGARLELSALTPEGDTEHLASTTAGPDGAFSFGRAPFGRVRIEARLEDHLPADRALTLTESRPIVDDVELRLEEGAELHGVAVDAEGRPVPALHVVARDAEGNEAETLTNARGGFVLTGLRAARHELVVTSRVRGGVQVRMDAAPGAEEPLRVEMPAFGSLIADLLVAEGETAQPRGTIEIRLLPRDAAAGVAELVLRGGSGAAAVELRAIPAGDYDVEIASSRYQLRDPVRAHVRVGETARVDLHLLRTRTLRGSVRDAEGRPAASVSVRARGIGPAAPRTRASIETGPDGRFTLTGLAAGDYEVEAVRGAVRIVDRVVVKPTLDASVELALPRTAALEVIVRDTAGEPVAGARLTLTDDSGVGIEAGAAGSDAVRATDAAGACVCSDLPLGTVRVAVDADGFDRRTVDAEVSDAGETVQVVLRRATPR